MYNIVISCRITRTHLGGDNMKKVKSVEIMVAITVVLALLAVFSAIPCSAKDITELRFGYQPSTHQIAYMTASDMAGGKKT